MEYVLLTRWEWQILCSQGSICMLRVRVCAISESSAPSDVYKLFKMAPQFNLGDAHAFVIAELSSGWRVSARSQFGASEVVEALSLESVVCFFPLTSDELDDLQEKAVAGAILVESPRFEHQWLEWVSEKTKDLVSKSSEKFVRALGLDEWLFEVSEAINKAKDFDENDPSNHGSLIGLFLSNEKKIVKDDQARSKEGTCAHAIACATLWASFVCGRTVPENDSDLRKRLDIRLERYLEWQCREPNYLTSGFHRELQALEQEAPRAFNELLTPTGLGIYLRFSVAIQSRLPPEPTDLVAAILRLQQLDGGLAAAACAYLIGPKLTPQFIHSIAIALDGERYPSVDSVLAAKSMGLGTLDTLRKRISDLKTDLDIDETDIEAAENHSEVHQSEAARTSVAVVDADPDKKV